MTASNEGYIKILVESVRVEGNGAILLTGPSSCGKGEIAKSISSFLSLSGSQHVSMGDVLRKTIATARADESFRRGLAVLGIDSDTSIFDERRNSIGLVMKARGQATDFHSSGHTEVSQLDWLEYCVTKGLLIPDDWAEGIIESHFRNSPNLQDGIFVLDGYPRTTVAAEKLLHLFDKAGIGIIKVIHLSITKAQMKIRAESRGRTDDTEEGLDSRYQFYVEKVQPCIDFLKSRLGPSKIALVDAHQPVSRTDGSIDVDSSIRAVTMSVIEALGLPHFLLDLKNE